MPRPISEWTLPEEEEKTLIASIGAGGASFRTFAEQVLRHGYPRSAAIPRLVKSKLLADQALFDFDALPPSEIARLNNEKHAKIISNHRGNVDRLAARRLRYQNVLAAAQAFTPPSAEHRDFADFLISKMQQAIAELPTPGADPPKATPAAFVSSKRADLQRASDNAGREAARDSVADVQWVGDLLAAL